MPNTSSIVPSEAELRFWLKVLRGGIGTTVPGPDGAGAGAASRFGAAIFFEAAFAFCHCCLSEVDAAEKSKNHASGYHNRCDSFAYFLSL
jgi:hypothetical protein